MVPQRMSSAEWHACTHVDIVEIEAQQQIIKKENSNGRCTASTHSAVGSEQLRAVLLDIASPHIHRSGRSSLIKLD